MTYDGKAYSQNYSTHISEASDWNQGVGGGNATQVAIAQVGHLLTEKILPAPRLLELGCGGGRIWEDLVHHVDPSTDSYIGIDVVPALVEQCDRTLRDLELDPVRFEARFAESPQEFPRGYEADAIFAFSVFTHMEPEDIVEILRVLKACAAPGARGLFTFIPLETQFGRANFNLEGDLALSLRYTSRVRNVAMTLSMGLELFKIAGWESLTWHWRERPDPFDENGLILTNQSWIVASPSAP